ncbi:hypothetical protein KY361_03245 [Candidatus Woesearchaeota archaeon]|nr:hypothetical protein [Candidatus Woesearchaeota archaeon]
MTYIKNEDLKLEDIPKNVLDDKGFLSKEFNEFKRTGVKGSEWFGKAKHVLKKIDDGEKVSLTELRLGLFDASEHIRWTQEHHALSAVKKILEQIRIKVENKELD